MDKIRLDTSQNPRVIITEVSGDLNLKGQDQPVVIIKVSGEIQPNVDKVGDQISIGCESECVVYVPHAAQVEIREVSGDCSIKSLAGSLHIQNIGRELTLRDTGGATIENIGIDLSAKRVNGDLKIDNIGRGAIVRDINGAFTADNIGQHLHLRDVSGSISAEVGGTADIVLAPVPWQTYKIEAGGALNCRLSEEPNAVLNLSSAGRRISVTLPEFSDTIREETYTVTVGEGGAVVELAAGGALTVSSRRSGWESFGSFEQAPGIRVEEIDSMADEIEEQITSQLDQFTSSFENMFTQIEGSLRGVPLSERQAERIRERLERAKERASERAQAAAERARARMELRLERARRTRGHIPPIPPVPPIPPIPPIPAVPPVPSKGWSASARFNWSGSAAPAPAADEEPVHDDERLLILRMLEEKQISAAEAEQLLAALEGRSE